MYKNAVGIVIPFPRTVPVRLVLDGRTPTKDKGVEPCTPDRVGVGDTLQGKSLAFPVPCLFPAKGHDNLLALILIGDVFHWFSLLFEYEELIIEYFPLPCHY